MTGRMASCLLAVSAFFLLVACGDVASVDEPVEQAGVEGPGKWDSPFFDDATLAVATGSHEVTSAEYRFQAEVVPEVLEDREIEIWAQVYHPVEMGDEPHPYVLEPRAILDHQSLARVEDWRRRVPGQRLCRSRFRRPDRIPGAARGLR